ncbi:MAG TPA: carbohydrate ABC transporter permease, partial [Armatimonadota bacterium]
MTAHAETRLAAKRSARAQTALRYAVLSVVCLLFLAPFFWMVSTSLKGDAEIFTFPPVWIPHPVVTANYPRALAAFPFLRYTANTLFLCGMCMIGVLFSCSLPAYGFSRLQWKGRDVLFVAMLATLMLPGQATMLPVFLLFRWLHWTGTFKPLFVPAFFGNAFSIFLLRQFFLTIPRELQDAARMDGCSELGTMARIILPLARPALATVALFTFMGTWTDYLGPLIYLHDENQYTLALGLQAFLGRHGADWSALMAAATAVTIPPVILFLFAQKTFIEGVALTG